MNISPMGLSCGDDDFEIGENGVPYLRDVGEESTNVNLQCQTIHNDIEFWPVEHPMEPQDEDRPVKCPIPSSSSITDGRIREKRNTESLRKRPSMARREGTVVMAFDPPVRAVRKRHLTFSHGDHIITPFMRTRPPPLPAPAPPLPNQNVTIFEMLQESDKFE